MDRNFYQEDTVTVARKLIGKKLVRVIEGVSLSGIIVETEAYCFKNDLASHAYGGKTKRNAAMFGLAGTAYVYFIYGNHFCFNVVAKQKGVEAGAVLIRGLEPISGMSQMMHYRKKADIKNLTNGPGKLTQAFCITKNQNNCDLTMREQLYLCEGISVGEDALVATPRIGISVAEEYLWRFCLRGNTFVSRKI